MPAQRWRPLVVSLGYTLGFLVVVLGREQLFTENTVKAILPLLDDPEKLTMLRKVARLWSVVLISNVAGAALSAYAASCCRCIGNVLGGVALVALLNYAQVVAEGNVPGPSAARKDAA